MALSEYQVVVGDKQTIVNASSPRVAINRALVRIFQHNTYTRLHLNVHDNQIPRGKTLIVTCNRR